MIVELLKDKGLLPALTASVDLVVFPLRAELRGAAQQVASRLRTRGRSVEVAIEDDKKLKWAFKHAERLGARELIIVGPDEWARNVIKIKDLRSGEEREAAVESL